MHTTTIRQFSPLPDRPRQARGRLRVPARGSVSDVKSAVQIKPQSKLPLKESSSNTIHSQTAVARPVQKHTYRFNAKQLAKTAHQADLLSKVSHIQTTKQSPISKLQHIAHTLFSRRSFAGFAVALILVSTGYVTVDTWMTNRQVTAQASGSNGGKAGASGAGSEHDARSEGRDETPLPANALATYSVSPDKPRAVYIDKLGVKARVLPVGVNTDNSMQAPTNVYDSGWYTGSSSPGELGAVGIDGHSSGATKLGVFGKLGELEKGDMVTIEKGDGKKIKYKVVAKETVDKDKVDMRKFLLPYGDALRGANFITCSGDWTEDNSSMTKRVIVYTQQVS